MAELARGSFYQGFLPRYIKINHKFLTKVFGAGIMLSETSLCYVPYTVSVIMSYFDGELLSESQVINAENKSLLFFYYPPISLYIKQNAPYSQVSVTLTN